MASLQIGGHRDATAGEVLESALSDATTAVLLSQLLRGDRRAVPDLLLRLRPEL